MLDALCYSCVNANVLILFHVSSAVLASCHLNVVITNRMWVELVVVPLLLSRGSSCGCCQRVRLKNSRSAIPVLVPHPVS